VVSAPNASAAAGLKWTGTTLALGSHAFIRMTVTCPAGKVVLGGSLESMRCGRTQRRHGPALRQHHHRLRDVQVTGEGVTVRGGKRRVRTATAGSHQFTATPA
jgi:hypothetical protein